ncbi:hypothetical protein OEZ86_010218 [Tetradesmus obliquus]|nr:hypothetical protein OEZ86_010218 [Tetradesmus obliquus]
MAKRVREFQSVSFEQQLKAFKPLRVNPFSLMMEAARTAAHQDVPTQEQQQPQQQQHMPNSRQQQAAQHHPGCHVPCTHCGCGLSELSVQQCHSCKNVYCCSCSVINYDAREDRVFCLDCLPGAAVTCCSRDDDDFEMQDQFDQSTTFDRFDHFDRPSFDMGTWG